MSDADRRRSGQGRANAASDAPGQAADLTALARDWITLWQSELASAAVDREAQETWQTMLAMWAGAASSMLASVPAIRPADPPRERTRDGAGSAAAPRAPPAAAAPDPRDAEIQRLAHRVAELEQRLATLEQRRKPRRPPKN